MVSFSCWAQVGIFNKRIVIVVMLNENNNNNKKINKWDLMLRVIVFKIIRDI